MVLIRLTDKSNGQPVYVNTLHILRLGPTYSGSPTRHSPPNTWILQNYDEQPAVYLESFDLVTKKLRDLGIKFEETP